MPILFSKKFCPDLPESLQTISFQLPRENQDILDKLSIKKRSEGQEIFRKGSKIFSPENPWGME